MDNYCGDDDGDSVIIFFSVTAMGQTGLIAKAGRVVSVIIRNND